MRFLVDECVGPSVARWLRDKNHDVCSIYNQFRGMSDNDVLAKAFNENRILITNDKDFGEKVFRENLPHKGIILLRLDDERTPSKISALQRLLENYESIIADNFIVVTEKQIRIANRWR